jgi:hypothetical protein
MPDRDFTEAIATKSAAVQRAEEQSADVSGLPALQRAATDQVVCRAGDASCAKAHAATVSRSPASQSLLRLQRQYGNRYAREVLRLARKSENDTTSPAVERSIESARGGGHGLDTSVRGQMEPAFGADFSGVRVHTDARADSLNRSLSAKAFTTGQDIFFRKDAYSPGTSSGRELLAHELTHVVQQNGDQVHRQMSVSQPGDRHEVEADHMARAVMQQEQQASPGNIDRQPEVPKEDEEKKKLHAKLDTNGVARQAEEEQAP